MIFMLVLLISISGSRVYALDECPPVTAAGIGGEDYPFNLNLQTLQENPKEFVGFYERMRYMDVKENPLLSQMLSIVNESDINKIFGIEGFSIGFLHLYGHYFPAEEQKEVVRRRYPSGYVSDVFDIDSGGYMEIYIESSELIEMLSQYCFAYGNRLFFSRQWFKGLYLDMNNYIKTLLGGLQIELKTVIWRFKIQDGNIIESCVYLNEFYKAYTPVYYFERDVLERIPEYRE